MEACLLCLSGDSFLLGPLGLVGDSIGKGTGFVEGFSSAGGREGLGGGRGGPGGGGGIPTDRGGTLVSSLNPSSVQNDWMWDFLLGESSFFNDNPGKVSSSKMASPVMPTFLELGL